MTVGTDIMRRILPILSFAILAGCSASNLLAPSGPPPALYTLSVPAASAPKGERVDWQLLVETPTASLDLNSSRIAVAPSPERIDYYADVAWADRVPALLQALIIESFDQSGRIAGVDRQHGGLRADFVLETELRDFQVESERSPAVAHLKLTAKLVRMRDRSIVATRTFDAATPVGDGPFPATVAAFDGALSEILPLMVSWTLSEGSRAR